MYKIIGADGNEYGPVTVEQLRQWIAEGRANAQTRVHPEGSAGWKALGELPEFSSTFSSVVGALPVPATQTMAGGYEVDIAGCINRGWKLLQNNFWRLVGTTFLIFLILGVTGMILRMLVNMALGVPFHVRGVHGFAMLRLQWCGILVNSLWNLFLTGALLGGLCQYYLKLMRGQPASVADAFAGFGNAFAPLTLAHVVRTVLATIGFFLCILPGIYLSVAWRFALPLVIDKRLGFWEAMEASRNATKGRWWSLFALFLLAGLISASGFIVCCIGVFATAPIGIAAILYAYEDIFGGQPAATAQTI